MIGDLKELGITGKEAAVYLAALGLKKATVQEISQKAGAHRTYTYQVLESLRRKGFVSSIGTKGKRRYAPTDPGRLLSTMQERERRIAHVIPQLKAMYAASSPCLNVEVHEGKEGLKTILEDILATGSDVVAYGSTKKQLEVLKSAFPHYIRKRVEAGIRTRVITERSRATVVLSKKDRQELREIRFLPGNLKLPTMTNAYADKVAILSLEGNPFGIIVEDPHFAATQRAVFSMLWKIADKPR